MTTDFREEAMRVIGARLQPVLSQLERVTKEEERSAWDASYKLPAREFPYSCTMEEGLALYTVVRANELRSGYEIATAFGVSSIFLGLGLQANQGSLLSVDCYVEETKESFQYTEVEIQEHVLVLRQKMAEGYVPAGLAFARQAAVAADLAGIVDFRVGVSPKDIPELLGGRQVDVALIDGGHYGDQPLLDLQALLPFLSAKCAVFFHDNNGNESVTRAIGAAERHLRTKALTLETYYRLTLVSRGLSAESLSGPMALPKRARSAPPKRTFRGMLGSIRRALGISKRVS